MTKKLREVVQALEDSRQVLICSHIEPDGDSIGSQLALAEFLDSLGKEVRIVNQDPVPERYHFLDTRDQIRDHLPSGFSPDTAVILDCSNPERLGRIGKLITERMVTVTIDHHRSNPGPDDPAFIDLEASSTGELIIDIIQEMDGDIDPRQADRLYTAIFSDTGGFRFPNTTAKSLAAAAELARCGARPHEIAARIYEKRSLASLKLLGRALGKIDALENGRVTMVSLASDDLEQCGAGPGEAEGIVDALIAVKGTLVGVLTRQMPTGVIKVNLRTRSGLKANKIAEAMGGGGHPNAAGYRTSASPVEARETLLAEIRKWL